MNGFCRFNIVPVRAEAAHRSELVTQLLFGDHYEILETDEEKKWARIKISFDEYEGWIDYKQHTDFPDIYTVDYNIVTKDVGMLKGGGVQTLIPAGCFLPKLQKAKVQISNLWYHFDGANRSANQRASLKELLEVAHSYYGTPYLWGGKTHFGIDCSGFLQQVFKICGYSLKRDAWQQALQGETIQLNEVQAGDIAFFANASGRVTHVGLMLDNTHIIHAHGHVRIDTLDERGIFNKNINGYSHDFQSIKRILMVT